GWCVAGSRVLVGGHVCLPERYPRQRHRDRLALIRVALAVGLEIGRVDARIAAQRARYPEQRHGTGTAPGERDAVAANDEAIVAAQDPEHQVGALRDDTSRACRSVQCRAPGVGRAQIDELDAAVLDAAE